MIKEIAHAVKAWFESARDPFVVAFDMSPQLASYHRYRVLHYHESKKAEEAVERARKALEGKIPIDYPEDDPRRRNFMEANRRFSNIRESLREKLKGLRKDIPDDELEKYDEAWKEWFFSDENTIEGSTKEHMSPSGHYKLVVTQHKTSPGCWSYTKGTVYRFGDDKPIEIVKRNYSQFPYSWVENHSKTGHDYLICGEDYQGQTFIDLTMGERQDHLPHAASKGHGFCWADHHPSPDGTMLAVEGCYWGGLYEVVIYDFTDPMADHPPIELHRESEYENFHGWNDDNSCNIGHRRNVVHPRTSLHGKSSR